MNLSFLTADFWSVLIALKLFNAKLHVLYFPAFAIIIMGIIAYNLSERRHSLPSPAGSTYRELDEEGGTSGNSTRYHGPVFDDTLDTPDTSLQVQSNQCTRPEV